MTHHAGPDLVETRVIDPLRGSDWDDAVRAFPGANVFHASAWGKLLATTYGHHPAYLQLSRDGSVAALLPLLEVGSRVTGKRGVSLPFSDFCSPLLTGRSAGAELIAPLTELARVRGWKYFELRGAPFLHNVAEPVKVFHGHRLDLTQGLDSLQEGFASSVRRNIRKAEQSGVTVRVATSREAVLQYYKLHMRTRRRHGLPPQSLRFFLNLQQTLLAPGLGFLVLAEKDQRPLAGALFLQSGQNAVYKFGASDERLQEFRANNLVMWEGIRFLSEQGSATLHFGRTSLENEGLRRFKLGWGTEEEVIEYFRFDPVRGEWAPRERDLTGFATKIFGRMPLALNRLVGTIVYPHLD